VNLLAYPLHVITDKEQIKKRFRNIIPKRLTKWSGNGFLSFIGACTFRATKEKRSYFVKSHLPNSRPPLSSLNQTIHILLLKWLRFQAIILWFWRRGTNGLGLKYNKGLLPKQWKSLKIIGLGVDNKTIVM
jgi:hypothetical protein